MYICREGLLTAAFAYGLTAVLLYFDFRCCLLPNYQRTRRELYFYYVRTFTEKWSQSKNVVFTICQPEIFLGAQTFLGHFYYQVSPFLKNYCNFTKISKSYKGKSFFAIFTMLTIVSDIFEHVQYHLCMHVPLIP